MDNHNLQKLRRKMRHEERKAISIRLNEYFASQYKEGINKDTLRNDLSKVVHNLDDDPSE